MKENRLSSIVAVDGVDGWPYRLYILENGGIWYIGGVLIICGFDETTEEYNIVDGSDIESVTKVRNLPCGTRLIPKSTVEHRMSIFANSLHTVNFDYDEIQINERTSIVDDGSGLTYDDLNTTLIIDDSL